MMYLIDLSANPLGICHKGHHDTPNITLINTHAKRNSSTDLKATYSNAPVTTDSEDLRCLHPRDRFHLPPTP
jgi:hypothetical protein